MRPNMTYDAFIIHQTTGQCMRFEKTEQLFHLAMMMQASAEGIGLMEICQEFDVSRRTAERMRDAVMRIYPQVEEVRLEDKTKRWRIPSNTLTGMLQPTAEDLAELKVAIDMLQRDNLDTHANNLHKLWLKLKGAVRPESASRLDTDLEALIEAEGYAMRPGPRPKIEAKVLYTLREAIKGFRKVRITYCSRFKQDCTERVVHPYGFIYGVRHYLIAWCELAQDLRSFSLSGIQDISLMSLPFTQPEGFNLQAYAERSFGVFQEEPYPVTLRFSCEVAADIQEYRIHPTQRLEEQGDGSLLVHFTAGGWKEICWFVLQWEGEAEIIAPEHLKRAYGEMLERLTEE